MESQPVALMSGGQKQRAAIARAIVMRPRLLLLDEPMSSLDADLRRRMRDVLFGVRDQFDLTFVHVTHDQAEALAISDQMAVMKNGRIEQLGTPRKRSMSAPVPALSPASSESAGISTKRAPHFARPEWVEVSRTDNGQGWRACSVVQADYSGDRWLLTIATTAVPLLAFTRDPQLATPGTNLWFRASRSIQF